jgi:hypothetical protein
MSNIRLHTIIPYDDVEKQTSVIDLQGPLSVTSLFATSDLDATTPALAGVALSGGLGVTKTIAVGGNIRFSSNAASSRALITQSTTLGSDDKGIILAGGGDSTTTRGAILELSGNELDDGSVRLGTGMFGTLRLSTGGTDALTISPSGTINIYGNEGLLLHQGSLVVNSTADAVNVASGGSATFGGGMAVAGKFFVGGDVAALSKLGINDTTESTGLESGSLSTRGGTSISKNLYVGGTSNLLGNLTVSGDVIFESTHDNSLVVFGSTSISKSLTVSGTVNVDASTFMNGILSLSNPTDSTGITNGALVVTGGAGIGSTLRVGKSLYVVNDIVQNSSAHVNTFAGAVSVTNTTESVDWNTGSLRVAGGASMLGNVRIGRDLHVNGSTFSTGHLGLNSATVADVLQITSTTPSVGVQSGALIVAGGMGISGSLYSNGSVVLSNSVDSTSTVTGTLILSNGGLGVAKSVHIGNSLYVGGTSTFLESVVVPDVEVNGALTVSNTSPSTDATTGCAVFAGGVGIIGNLNVGTGLFAHGTSNLIGNTIMVGTVHVTNTTEASSLVSASIVAAGGLAVQKSLRVGTDAVVNGSITVNEGLTLLSATASDNINTGAAVVVGGVGVGGSINVGSKLAVEGSSTFGSDMHCLGSAMFADVTDAASPTTGSIVSAGGIAVSKGAYVGTNLTVLGTSHLAELNVTDGVMFSGLTESTSASNGALVVSGGIGVGGNLNVANNLSIVGNLVAGGIATFADATDSTSLTAASAVYAGGVSVTKNLTIGGGLSVGADSTLAGIIHNVAGAFLLNTVSLTDLSATLYIRSSNPSIRLAGNDVVKAAQYPFSLDLFSLGNRYTDAHHEVLQVTTTSSDTYSVQTRAVGSGILHRLSLQTGTNVNQVLLNVDGSVVLAPATTTLDSTSPTTGSALVSGGLGVRNSISVGSILRIFGATSGNVSISAPNTTASYSLILPSSVAPANNYALVSDTSGNLTWSQMITPNPNFQSVHISNTTASTSPTSGALTVAGGVGIGGSAYVGGDLYLSNAIISDRIGWQSPAYNVRSVGTRFVLHPALSASTVDYAIGVEDSHLWFSVDRPDAGGFKWYSGTKNTLTLDPDGNLFSMPGGTHVFAGSVSGTVTLSPPPTVESYRLQLPGYLPPSSNMALVADTVGNMSWSEMITPNPTFNSVNVSSSTPNTSIGTGALVVAGGGSFGDGLSVGGYLHLTNVEKGLVTLAAPVTDSNPTFILPSNLPTSSGQVLRSDTSGNLSWGDVQNATGYTVDLNNNVDEPTVISGLKFDDAFTLEVLVRTMTASATYGTSYTLRGVLTANGWVLFQSLTGDQVGLVDFSIDPSGQIMYTTGNLEGWIGATVHWTGPSKYSTPSGGTPQLATGNNNQTNPADVAGLTGIAPQFSHYVVVTVRTTTVSNSSVTLYLIQGTRQPDGTWDMVYQLISGPDPGIAFSINGATGQMQYTSPDISGWLSTTFAFYGDTVPLQNAANFDSLVVSGEQDATTGVNATGSLQVLGGTTVHKSLKVGNSLWVQDSVQVGNLLQVGQQAVGTHTFESYRDDGELLSIRNTAATGFSGIQFLDEGGATRASLGWSNPDSVAYFSSSSTIVFTNTSESNSLSSGSFQVDGGTSIAKNAWIGGSVDIGKNLNLDGDVTINSTTAATSIASGALQIAGGIGVTDSVHVGMNVIVDQFMESGSHFRIGSIAIPSGEQGSSLGWNTWSNDFGSTELVNYHGEKPGGWLFIDGTTNNWSYVIHSDGTTGSASDERLKSNIQTIQNAGEKVDALRGVNFDFKSNGKRSMGLIAQEVESVLPECVETLDNGFKSVNYPVIVGLLIEAIKELKQQMSSLL